MANKPPLFKEILVGLLVGGLFGPVIGWFIGTFAALFAVAAMDTENVRTIRGSGFIGGLIGIALGFATGPVSSLPMRLISTRGPVFLDRGIHAFIRRPRVPVAVNHVQRFAMIIKPVEPNR